jgi:hypothetical protein
LENEMNDERAPSPVLVIAWSLEANRSLIAVLEGGGEGVAREALAGLLDGRARPPLLALKCAEVRGRLPRVGGQWARAIEWDGGEIKVFSVHPRSGSPSGTAKAVASGALAAGVTYRLTVFAAGPGPHEALAALEGDLSSVWTAEFLVIPTA